MNWEKGPVCGVDNCPSDQWRSAAGRTFCRFGHQRQNEIEYDHEDEVGGGRKVTIGTLEAANDGEVDDGAWYGPRLYALQVQIFQEVLRFYTHWAIQKLDLDIDLEEEVKELWELLIRHTLFGRATYDFEDGVTSEGCPATSSAAGLKLNAVLALVVLMLALIRLSYPITPVIIITWIRSGELPYDEIGNMFVPEEARERIHFTGSWTSYYKRPSLWGFDQTLVQVIAVLREEGVEFSQPLAIQIIHTVEALMLPLDVIDRAIWLAKGVGLGETQTFTKKNITGEPIALVIMAARIAYYKSWQSYDEDIKAPFWKLYSELAEIYYQDPHNSDERNYPAWTDDRYNEFLDEYQKSFMVEIDDEKVSIQRKRVNDLFPIQPTQQEPTVTASDMTQILHEQIVPLPSRAPKEVEGILREFHLQGPPLYTAVLDAAARAHCLTTWAILHPLRQFEAKVKNVLRAARKKKKEETKAALKQESLSRQTDIDKLSSEDEGGENYEQ